MADPMTGPITSCPWCSAALPVPGVDLCPACGAALVSKTGGADPDIKGVTTLDTEAILRARAEVARPRSRLLSFITGEAPAETGAPASSESLARPPAEVRREMLRLELEAQQAELEAETIALKSDVIARQGIHVSQLGGVPEEAPAGEAAPASEAAPATEAAPEP
ncbi:MAG: hypothetical protein MUQ32_10210 [Chloroflexi bacterium]|nr:hypothetical protein [Chloroflexota bacterium]